MSNKNSKRKALSDDALENVSGGIFFSDESKTIIYNKVTYHLEHLRDDDFNKAKMAFDTLEEYQDAPRSDERDEAIKGAFHTLQPLLFNLDYSLLLNNK